MSRKHSHASDIRGFSRLLVDAIIGVADLVEEVNLNVLRNTLDFAAPLHRPVSRATTLVYRQVRGLTRAAGLGVDGMLTWATPLLLDRQGWAGREQVVAVLNGVLGDYLHASANPLAIEMELRSRGTALPMNSPGLREAMPALNGRILVLVHGLCMSDLLWRRNSHEHGAALERDCGITPVYLRYNSGLHISTNGRQFAGQLETLLRNWPVPVEQLCFLGHSMGGMVIRSAFHYGMQTGQHWPSQASKIIFLGTPHHGAPLERGGNWFHLFLRNSRFLAPFANLGNIRSAGITDLRYGNLLDEDWEGLDRFEHHGDRRAGVPLPETAQCYALAATIGRRESDMRDRLVGDSLVPTHSALGESDNAALHLAFRPENRIILRGINHLDLLSSKAVYQQLRKWMQK